MDQSIIKKEPLGNGFYVNVTPHHTFGTDAVLLSHFSAAKQKDRLVDLGTGCGIIPLLLLRDGKLQSAVYSVLGREISSTLISVDLTLDGINVKGLVCKPVSCRASRAYQFTFLNGRYVQSGTVTAATEQAYKNSAMVGKFPVFVLCVAVPLEMVDVNVHPAKTQVRFSDEKRVFTAV